MCVSCWHEMCGIRLNNSEFDFMTCTLSSERVFYKYVSPYPNPSAIHVGINNNFTLKA